MSIAQNIAVVRSRIAAAARRAGRSPEAIALMAVSKTVAPAAIREAYAAGLRLFGESRVQELARKTEALRDLPDAEWHMIGHLQANKSHKAAELFAAVDSVDSLRLAQRLNVSASQLGKKVAVLLEINVGGEAAKSGLVRRSPELDEILRAAPALENLADPRVDDGSTLYRRSAMERGPIFASCVSCRASCRERSPPSGCQEWR